MSKKTVYNFLELEFKKLYDDMKIFIENKELRNVFNNHKKLLKDIVYYIYFNNEIYYEKGLSIYDNIKLLREARLVDEYGEEKQILTFGPLCILPEDQRMGYGKMLLEHSFQQAELLGYDGIVIFGNPGNYVSRGFQSCKKYNISLENKVFPAAMMAKELKPGALKGRTWTYYDSPVMHFNEEDAQRFDDTLEKMEKKHQPSQEEF